MEPRPAAAGAAFVERLLGAVRHRDLDALTACFAEDYRNETPAHPARSFAGLPRSAGIGSRSSLRFQTSPRTRHGLGTIRPSGRNGRCGVRGATASRT